MLKDLFTFGFLNKLTSFSIPDTLIPLAISLCVGLFIFVVYKRTYKGVMYSSAFGISLVAMGLITTLVILAVSSNLITSLGMVGALSIVRFRTVVKEPLDLVYLFWCISAGIIVGVGLIPLAVIGSLVIGVILFVFSSRGMGDPPYVAVIRCEDDEAEESARKLLESATKKCVVKAKSVTREGVELTAEVRLREGSSRFLNDLLKTPGVIDASLVSFHGEYYD